MEVQVGPFNANLRVLLEPKGFIRIIIFFIAIVAFSTTAGFHSGSTSNFIKCQRSDGVNDTAYLTFSYPYSSSDLNLRSLQGNYTPFNSDACSSAKHFSPGSLSTSSQFFVAMGVLTMIYVAVALLIYVLFITPELFLAKWLVIGDFVVTILFSVLYLFACIAWSVGIAQLNSYVSQKLEDFGTGCLGCSGGSDLDALNGQLQGFLQPAVSLIFGWLTLFVWVGSIWFVYKDTEWHRDLTGPLASLYANKSKGGGNAS